MIQFRLFHVKTTTQHVFRYHNRKIQSSQAGGIQRKAIGMKLEKERKGKEENYVRKLFVGEKFPKGLNNERQTLIRGVRCVHPSAVSAKLSTVVNFRFTPENFTGMRPVCDVQTLLAFFKKFLHKKLQNT